MLIRSLQLTNFLSFGAATQPLELRPLNVIIGANGSGKSNLLEAIDLLRAAPHDIQAQIRECGGVHDLLWKGARQACPVAAIDAVLNYQDRTMGLRHSIGFTEVAQRFEIVDEKIEDEKPVEGHDQPCFYYIYEHGKGIINIKEKMPRLQREDIKPAASILAQRKDPDQYPELTWLGNTLGSIRLYREWHLGRDATVRWPQKTDVPNDFLSADGSNLWLVLQKLCFDPAIKEKILNALQNLYEGIDDFKTLTQHGTIQAFLRERNKDIPATRLSDGTLHYLCLLAVLCHPDPPPLVCMEEPELGLHPDVLPTLAELLVDASERTQIIVTTHSDVLVDALTDCAEAVVVAERDANGTTLTRLDAEQLKPWLEKYRLGQLWKSGEIGGNRW